MANTADVPGVQNDCLLYVPGAPASCTRPLKFSLAQVQLSSPPLGKALRTRVKLRVKGPIAVLATPFVQRCRHGDRMHGCILRNIDARKGHKEAHDGFCSWNGRPTALLSNRPRLVAVHNVPMLLPFTRRTRENDPVNTASKKSRATSCMKGLQGRRMKKAPLIQELQSPHHWVCNLHNRGMGAIALDFVRHGAFASLCRG